MRILELFNKDCTLDHIAIAVEDLDKAQKVYENLGLSFENTKETVTTQGVVTAFAHASRDVRIELLGVQGDGAVKTFLEKKGAGIHHICFRVPDIVEKCRDLFYKGFKLVYEEPQPGADNCLVNFLHPRTTGGVLIEIQQRIK